MKFWKKLLVVFCLLALMVPTFGCEEEGAMEKAGKKMDEAAEEASESVKKIFD